jgi:hypothetical protein
MAPTHFSVFVRGGVRTPARSRGYGAEGSEAGVLMAPTHFSVFVRGGVRTPVRNLLTTPVRAALALGVLSANGSGFCIHPPSPSRRGSFSIFRTAAVGAVGGVWDWFFWRWPCPNERR